MSGYRTLHRENTNVNHVDGEESETTSPTTPIWHTLFSPCAQSRPPHHKTNPSLSPPLRFVTASADGYLRAYEILDKEVGDNDTALDASALKLKLTNVLCGAQQLPPPSSTTATNRRKSLDIGYAKIDIVRNYIGQDTASGDEVIAGLRLDGLVRLWVRPQCPPYKEEEETNEQDDLLQKSLVEFEVEDCTGTAIAIRPPSHSSASTKKNNNLIVAIPSMNGSISFYDCGIPIYNPHSKNQDEEGTEYEEPKLANSIGSGGAIIMSIVYHPTQIDTIAVGRKNGVIDVYSSTDGGISYKRLHHFTNHYKPIRALSFSSSSSSGVGNGNNDGALLITASDDGNVFLYDIYSRSSAVASSLMVASIPNAHTSWILSSCAIPKTPKFVTAGADGKIKVWDISMINAGAAHTFDGGTGSGGDGKKHMVWGVCVSGDGRRMVSCDDGGMLQVYSCEE